jgi:L,D-peptidoglycan transpeptidase YkuD (ErfK/YbiS/YcfS/YnhG family)
LRVYGQNGINESKKEGDGCTPAGLFRLGHAFGIREKPETKMSYLKVTADSFWWDDAASPHYNTWVEGMIIDGWQSAERLLDYPREYSYGVVIEYNTAERMPGKGSAVFLHCGSKPTSGCVAVPEAALLRILKWLDPEKRPATDFGQIAPRFRIKECRGSFPAPAFFSLVEFHILQRQQP